MVEPAVRDLGDDPLCKKGDSAAPTSPPHSHGEVDPEEPTSPASAGDEREREPADVGVPEPVGAPPRLSEQQCARLHQLLGQRDADGRTPYNLDTYHTDQEMWDTYRKVVREQYRAHRKRKRAEGTWEKDDHRWRPLPPRHELPRREPQQDRPPLSRLKDRSPLPRRRGPPT